MNIGQLILDLLDQGGITREPTRSLNEKAEAYKQRLMEGSGQDAATVERSGIPSIYRKAWTENRGFDPTAVMPPISVRPNADGPAYGPEPRGAPRGIVPLPLPPNMEPPEPNPVAPNPTPVRPPTPAPTSEPPPVEAGPPGGVAPPPVAGTPPVPVAPEPAPATDQPVQGIPAQAPVAEAYKSPPDLMEMYMKLQERSRNAAAMDRGMTLIAAGLAQDQNKQALINMASGIGGGSGGGISMDALINMQKMMNDQEAQARQRAQLPALMQQYNLDEATVQYLDSTGQLDEVISKLADPETQVVEKADGSKMLINSNTGETVKELSPAKPRETEFQKLSDGSQVLVYKDDKTRVDTGKQITEIGRELGPITVQPLADGTLQAVQDGKPIGAPFGPQESTTVALGDGTIQAIVNGQPVGKPFGPPKDLRPDEVQTWAEINRGKVARGEAPVPLEDWLIEYRQSGTEAGTIADINKKKWGNPPAGKYWVYDQGGAIRQDANGVPMSVWDESSKEFADFQKSQAEAAAKTQEMEDAATAAEAGDARRAIKGTVISQTVNETIDLIDAGENAGFFENPLGNVGWGVLGNWIPESEAGQVAGNLNTIKTAIGFDELKQMRAESKTGAALGNVTVAENMMLQQAFGSLNQGLPPEVLKQRLRRIDAATSMIVHGVPDGKGGFRVPTDQEIIDTLGDAMEGGEPPPAPTSNTRARITKRPDGVSVEDPNRLVPTGN